MSIRRIGPDDIPIVHGLLVDFAKFEGVDNAGVTKEALQEVLFGSEPCLYGFVAEDQGEIVGVAMVYKTFSTWMGTVGLFIQDLYVRPEFRGRGHGKALLRALAEFAKERNYERIDWWVLDWNENALRFYETQGAEILDGWVIHRLTRPAAYEDGGD